MFLDLFNKTKLKVLSIKYEITVSVEKDGDFFIAYCPGLDGLMVEGDTEKEVLEEFTYAFISYIQSAIKHGDDIPDCSTFKTSRTVKHYKEEIEVPLNIHRGSLLPA